MNKEKRAEIVPFPGPEGTKNPPLRKVCVKVYLNEPEFLEWARMAEEAGIRPRGLKPFRLKPHGFADERLANTKGLVKFLKEAVIPFWKDGEKDRKERRTRLLDEAEKLGLRLEKKS